MFIIPSVSLTGVNLSVILAFQGLIYLFKFNEIRDPGSSCCVQRLSGFRNCFNSATDWPDRCWRILRCNHAIEDTGWTNLASRVCENHYHCISCIAGLLSLCFDCSDQAFLYVFTLLTPSSTETIKLVCRSPNGWTSCACKCCLTALLAEMTSFGLARNKISSATARQQTIRRSSSELLISQLAGCDRGPVGHLFCVMYIVWQLVCNKITKMLARFSFFFLNCFELSWYFPQSVQPQ